LENSSKVILLTIVIIGITLFSLLIISIITFFQGIAHGCGISLNIDQVSENESDIASETIYNITREDLSISPFLLAEFDLMITNNSYNYTHYDIGDEDDDDYSLHGEKFEIFKDLIEEKIPALYNECERDNFRPYGCSIPDFYIRYENEVFSLSFSGYCT
jgi:hypothetical protein